MPEKKKAAKKSASKKGSTSSGSLTTLREQNAQLLKDVKRLEAQVAWHQRQGK